MPGEKSTRFASFPSAVTSVPLLLLFVSSPDVDACSPSGGRRRTLTEIILQASDVLIVLYGRVRSTFPDPRFDYGSGATAYTVEMEIYCALKGRRPDRRVNITNAGHIPGHCDSSNLTVDIDYVITTSYFKEFMTPDDAVYRIDSSEIDVTEDNLRQITQACGLQRIYPKGVEESLASVKCPVPAPPGQCRTLEDEELRAGRAVIGSCAVISLVSAAVVASLTITLCRRVLFTF